MSKVTFWLSAAAVAFFLLSLFVGSKEFSVVQFSQISTARQFKKLSKNEFEQGLSLISEHVALNACRDAMTRIFGRLQPSTLRARVAENCAEISGRITSASPAASYAHFIEALALFESGNYQGFSDKYVLSQVTGPNETWIAQSRFFLGERGLSEMTEPARTAHEKDLALLVQSQLELRVIAKHYVRKPEVRDRIAEVVERLSETDQRRFLSAVRVILNARGDAS